MIIEIKKICTVLIIFTCSFLANAQPMGNSGGRNLGRPSGQMNIGHFYGKIVDSKTNKGIGGVSVLIGGKKFDSTKKQMVEVTLKTAITENNGDFSVEGLMIFGNYKLKASAIGYKVIEKQISFGVKRPDGGGAPDAAAMQQMMALADKDLGNIKIEQDASNLDAVVVTSTSKQQFELGIDRKIFNVDKNIIAAGQTATELMKSIPSISVDVDGNVTLRNATPTIFVDGRPTTLTLDQIPVDIIDKVEIITNPSAKYDASGGNAGILNIILKKNKKNGYNGNLRAGIDSRAIVNMGGDINFRQNKVNFTFSGNYNQRKSLSWNDAFTRLKTATDTTINSSEYAENLGYFMTLRTGIDYFIDNRNTLTFNASRNRGSFDNEANQTIDSTANIKYATNSRKSTSDFNLRNYGLQLSYKHLFTQTGHSLSADVNYQDNRVERNAINNSVFNNSANNFLQNTSITGINKFLTSQIDYEKQFGENTKVEAGLRSATRNFETESYQRINNILSTAASARYKFIDNVYAAYTTYSFKKNKTSYQLGLRLESSNYTGTLLTLDGRDSFKFNIDFPLSLFPSLFITHKLTDKTDLQFNYSRRVNRPSFFQLIPNYDFTDPQNPTVGNPGLNPEFTHSLEFSYNNAYKKGSNFLATAYFRHSSNLITNYIYKDFDRLNNKQQDTLFYGSYTNANTSYSYGLELTNKMTITKWWEMMVNVNLFNAQLNANIPNQVVNNSLVSWFGKFNNTFKWNKGWSFQINWDFRSRLIIPQNSGGMRGGGMFGGQQLTLAQGFILPRWFDVDASIRKEWTWKNGQSGSITLAINDIFRARRLTEADALFFFQTTDKFRDPQVVRLNFSYRFGKADFSIFKRKNTKAENSGVEMM
jgi:outer membrane receptor protein involved in Fe transport